MSHIPPPDAVVEAVREDLKRRSELGLLKYGTGLDAAGLTLVQALQHAYEETLDKANYLKTAIMILRGELPCHGVAARDVPPGQPWAFPGHRTMAQVDADKRKTSPQPLPPGMAKPR